MNKEQLERHTAMLRAFIEGSKDVSPLVASSSLESILDHTRALDMAVLALKVMVDVNDVVLTYVVRARIVGSSLEVLWQRPEFFDTVNWVRIDEIPTNTTEPEAGVELVSVFSHHFKLYAVIRRPR